MGQALYRKYRSRSFDEVVGQDHITTTLKHALKNGTIGHAYLFTGPRGTGKTSVARILAHTVNELVYDSEAIHLDIIEIDAASNRRIDEIRELRERIHTAPASAKYKVYIIDEVHMLTREAFNALLKTLEEPPAHVIFILATTEAHKLPETIISRTQRFSFRPVDKAKVTGHLKTIAQAEKIAIEEEALELIAAHGGGSFRDSIGLLDQIRGLGKHVTQGDVQKLLGIPPAHVVKDMLVTLADGDKKQLLASLGQLNEQGFLATQIAKQMAQQLRTGLIEDKRILDPPAAASLLRQLLEVPASHDPDSLLEIILLSTTAPSVPIKEVSKPTSPPKIVDEAKAAEPIRQKETNTAPAKEPSKPGEESNQNLNEALWREALEKLKQQYNTLYSIARIAAPRFEKNELILVLGFPFHQKRLNEPRNKQVISDIVSELAGAPVVITCELNPKYKPTNFYNPRPEAAAKKPEQNSLDTISNIFGGGEVLE